MSRLMKHLIQNQQIRAKVNLYEEIGLYATICLYLRLQENINIKFCWKLIVKKIYLMKISTLIHISINHENNQFYDW